MTSLLAFAWRRTQQQQQGADNGGKKNRNSSSKNGDEEAPPSPAPPAVAASQSGDTTIVPRQQESFRDDEDDVDGASVYVRLTRIRSGSSCPRTPEGLRPRRSIEALRRELQLPTPDDRGDPNASSWAPPLPSSDPPWRLSLFSCGAGAGSVLEPPSPPPAMFRRPRVPPPLPTSVLPPRLPDDCVPAVAAGGVIDSWSTQVTSPPLSGTGDYYYDALLSPREGRYNERDDDALVAGATASSSRVARSPHLLPGRARTAVGAVVALRHPQQQQRRQQRRRHSSETAYYSPAHPNECRRWDDRDHKEGTGDDYGYYYAPGRYERNEYQHRGRRRHQDGDRRYSHSRDPSESFNRHDLLPSRRRGWQDALEDSRGRHVVVGEETVLKATGSADDDDDDSSASDGSMPYYPLDRDPVQRSRTPQGGRPLLSVRTSMERMPPSSNGDHRPQHQHQQQSPRSNQTSIVGSPSSMLAKPNHRPGNAHHASSPVSQTGLMHRGCERYDFSPILSPDGEGGVVAAGTEVVLVANHDQLTTVSAMSQSAVPDDDVSYDRHHQHGEDSLLYYYDSEQGAETSSGGLVEAGRAGEHAKQGDSDDQKSRYYPAPPLVEEEEEERLHLQLPHSGSPIGSALLRRKFANQRSAKEELILSLLERLQDDAELVADVEAINDAAVGMGDWFVKTPLDQPGLLTGFDVEVRRQIQSNLRRILDEMDLVRQEEFFMSPSQVPEYAEEHNDLRNALLFCSRLVDMALPFSERVDVEGTTTTSSAISARSGPFRWKFLPDLRVALGIIPPESPDNVVRGGDTSFFSLPSDSDSATPMASNVSMATSITTAVTGANNNHQHRDNDAPFCGTTARSRQLRQLPNGLQIRRTIEVFSSLLQKTTLACQGLADLAAVEQGRRSSSGTELHIRVTEELKRCYLQFLTVNANDLKALVGSFSLDAPQPLMARAVSCDDDQEQDGKCVVATEDAIAIAQRLADAPRAEESKRALPPPPALVRQHAFLTDPREGRLGQVSCAPRLQRQGADADRSPDEVVTAEGTSSCSSSAGGRDLFSPQTDDMRTWNGNEDGHSADEDEDQDVSSSSGLLVSPEFDDLRRQVGSTDHGEDPTEERDGPEDAENSGNGNGGAEEGNTVRCSRQVASESSSHDRRTSQHCVAE